MSEVIVAVDGSEGGRRAVQWAADEAVRRGAALGLVYASLYERYEAGSAHDVDDVYEQAHRASERMLAEQFRLAALGRPGLEVTARILPDETVPALLEAGRQAGLLVMGSRGLGTVKGVLLGSVSQRVAGRAPFPVVVVPAEAAASTHGRVVLGVGAHQPPGAAGEFAVRAAVRREAELDVVHAWEPDVDLSALSVVTDPAAAEARAHGRLDAVTADLRLGAPALKINARAVPGPAAPALLQAAAEADLLVLGVRRRHGGLGRVAHAVLHRAPCPVAVVPVAAGS